MSFWEMRAGHTLACLAVLGAGAGCGPSQPPNWQQGGARLVLQPARWDRVDDDPIEIREDGQVLEDGDLVFVLDVAGRVVDEDYEPVAILLQDGHVAGTDNSNLGRVGVNNASPPHYATAWLSVLPNGQVLRFDPDGERSSDGAWRGCDGPQMRTCTLVTHMVALRSYRGSSRSGVGVGVGIGIGIGY